MIAARTTYSVSPFLLPIAPIFRIPLFIRSQPRLALDDTTVFRAYPFDLTIRNVLRAALNRAQRWRLVKYNVAEAQAPKLIERTKGHRFQTLFTVAVALGLGEILGLR
jgi:hypothetical protein